MVRMGSHLMSSMLILSRVSFVKDPALQMTRSTLSVPIPSRSLQPSSLPTSTPAARTQLTSASSWPEIEVADRYRTYLFLSRWQRWCTVHVQLNADAEVNARTGIARAHGSADFINRCAPATMSTVNELSACRAISASEGWRHVANTCQPCLASSIASCNHVTKRVFRNNWVHVIFVANDKHYAGVQGTVQ
jgi:hypothetical protein